MTTSPPSAETNAPTVRFLWFCLPLFVCFCFCRNINIFCRFVNFLRFFCITGEMIYNRTGSFLLLSFSALSVVCLSSLFLHRFFCIRNVTNRKQRKYEFCCFFYDRFKSNCTSSETKFATKQKTDHRQQVTASSNVSDEMANGEQAAGCRR